MVTFSRRAHDVSAPETRNQATMEPFHKMNRTAKGYLSEEPGAVTLHAGICGNESQQRLIYPTVMRRSNVRGAKGVGHPRRSGSTGKPGGIRHNDGRRRSSMDGTSRMMREYHVRFCERLGVRFPRPTRRIAIRRNARQSAETIAALFRLRPSSKGQEDAC
jgi:hypothetical protein